MKASHRVLAPSTGSSRDNVPAASSHLAEERWLQRYYFTRAAFAFAWLAVAVTLAATSPALGAALLFIYPLWDALGNLADGRRSGGLARNRTQAINVGVSFIVAIGVAVALPNMHRVLAVFGAWAILSGLLQLGTGVRRWKEYGAQWAMILSGGQSALAGGFFIYQAQLAATPSVATVAGYAGFGGFYFLVSAVTLLIRARRRAS